ncbi:MAG: LD-carboxypeptidase [Lachnospiraceae bacterium]|nr:LD-carboxypeptidase [Lachnospiraceae bacterium]
MIFPKFLQPGDGIGVAAPSRGINDETDILRFRRGAKTLGSMGYPVTFTDHVFTDENGRSADGPVRGREMSGLFANPQIHAVISAAGGDFLVEMLPWCDFDAIQKNPKWVQGYSDNTSLLYYITTKLDIATVYGCHFGDFGMEPWQKSVHDALSVLTGRGRAFSGYEFYQDGFSARTDSAAGYRRDRRVKWVNGRDEDAVTVQGRLIGGCLDVLGFLCGTPYDGTLDFTEKYREDGILWYLESFSTNPEELQMKLWQFKQLGWFEQASGFLFGRPCMYNTEYSDVPYRDAVMSMLEEYRVPVIFDMDIGHKGPQFSMINGALARVESKNGTGSLTYLPEKDV